MSDSAKAEWVTRVLGIGMAPSKRTKPSSDFRSRWNKSFSAFRDAIEEVDGQMAALAAKCRRMNDPWLKNIADLGLPAVTGNFKTPLMAACMDVANAPPERLTAAAAKARAATANFAKHIASNPQVAGCDANPFGVRVSIRATLGPALNELAATLDQAS